MIAGPGRDEPGHPPGGGDAWLRRIADGTAALSRRVGTAASWLYPLLVLVLVTNVGLRYGLGRGFIELEELQWHLFSAAFLLGFAYTYAEDEHVRVDLLHAGFSRRTRAWIELLGCLLLLFPFAAVVTVSAWDFFTTSLALGERSPMPSGLPGRYVIKFVLFAAMALLTLQALGTAAASALVLRTGRGPGSTGDAAERRAADTGDSAER